MLKKRWMLMACLIPFCTWAKGINAHFDPVSSIIFWVTCIYCLSIVGQYFSKLFNQPAVLGELLMGIIFGNLCYYLQVPEVSFLREGAGIFEILPDLLAGNSLSHAVTSFIPKGHDVLLIQNALQGNNGADLIKIAYVLDVFSRYGLIYLLFMVGLESSWAELKMVGKPAMKVASLGVIAPIVLGFATLYYFYPHYSFHTNVFVAATLSATSVGITARVLKDLKKIRTREAKIILGAAMIDDVLGLFILAIVSSLVLQGHLSPYLLIQILMNSILFFVLAIYLGPKLIRSLVPFTEFLEPWEAKLVLAFVFLMFMSWLASLMQLSSIIGAFMAGLILDDELFLREGKPYTTLKIKDLMGPLQFLLAPLFFFIMGVQVKLETFMHIKVIKLALFLTVIAIIGKLIGGLGASRKSNRLFIGIGMIPRGEVGLIFAAMGKSLGVVSDQMFTAIVVMVILTTVIAPPWMKQSIQQAGELEVDPS
jgi:Kef-type K+ transport system membrane component KefB